MVVIQGLLSLMGIDYGSLTGTTYGSSENDDYQDADKVGIENPENENYGWASGHYCGGDGDLGDGSTSADRDSANETGHAN
jgi:hypothetical protein